MPLELLAALLNMPVLKTENYFKQWEKAAGLLLQWSQELANTWQEVINEAISADNLLVITLLLLPNDNNALKKIQNILDEISHFVAYGEIAYAMTNLYAAITAKLSHVEDNEKIDHHIYAVLDEFKMRNEIKEMKKNCEEYQKYLYESMQNVIKNNSICTTSLLEADQFVNEVIEEIKYKIINPDIKKPLAMLVQKYLLIKDILTTLNKTNLNTWSKQISFAEKFIQHYDFFKTRKSYFNFSYWLNYQTIEDIFLVKAEQFTNKIKTKELEKIQTTIN